eukprot:5508701-Amphidinium_carterae.1
MCIRDRWCTADPSRSMPSSSCGIWSLDATWGAWKAMVRRTKRDEENFDDSVRFAQWLHWMHVRTAGRRSSQPSFIMGLDLA